MMDIGEATTLYWKVKRAYYGRVKGISTERALQDLNKILAAVGPHHPLAEKTCKLQTSIILGE